MLEPCPWKPLKQGNKLGTIGVAYLKEFCKEMALVVGGKEAEMFDFRAALEATRKKWLQGTMSKLGHDFPQKNSSLKKWQ